MRTEPTALDDPWTSLAVPAGWSPIATACRSMYGGLDVLGARIAKQVAEEIEEYRTVPPSELSATISALIGMALFGLAEHRMPTAAELDLGYQNAKRRAQQGWTADPILRAFQIGFREFFAELVGLVSARNEALLLESITTVWNWLHQLSDAVVTGWHEEARAQDVVSAHRRSRFIELLVQGDSSSDEVLELCQSLGFKPEGAFRVMYVGREGGAVDVEAIRSAMKGADATQQIILRGLGVLILSQGASPELLEEAASRAGPGCAVGLSSERLGIGEVHAATQEAESAFRLGLIDGPSVRFERSWLLAVLLAHDDLLRPLLQGGIDTARKHPHLGDAVHAFVRGGFSISNAARTLHLQPSSLSYRLDRWRKLTGWDPSTPEGAAFALLAVRVARR